MHTRAVMPVFWTAVVSCTFSVWACGACLAQTAEPDFVASDLQALASGALPAQQAGEAGQCQHDAVADADAIFASPDGDDAHDGSATHPVLTPGRALALMAETGLRTAYFRSGTYLLAQPVLLGAGQAGMHLFGCGGERPVFQGAQGVPDTLVVVSDTHDVTLAHVLFGPTTPDGTALTLAHAQDCLIEDIESSDAGTAIHLDHASGNRLVGNTIRNAARTGIELQDASDDNVVAGNWINGAGAPETHGGGIFLHGVRRNRVAANLIENTAGMGIGISNWDAATVNVGNTVIGNIIRRTDLTALDSGAIYLLGRSQVDTRTVITSNWVDGVGSPDPDGQRHNVGIYLDDSTSGAVVVGNVVRNAGSDAVQIHGGSDNLVANNILDLGPGNPSAVLFQAAPADTGPTNAQIGNKVVRNIILSTSPAPKVYVWIEGGQPVIEDNLYCGALGAAMAGSAPVADSSPVLAGPGCGGSPQDGEMLSVYALAREPAAALIGFHPVGLPRIPAAARPAGQ